MNKPDVIDDIIRDINPEQIPHEFIIMAKVTTPDGTEIVVPGTELESVLQKHNNQTLDIRVILDVRKIRTAIIEETNKIFSEVNKI